MVYLRYFFFVIFFDIVAFNAKSQDTESSSLKSIEDSLTVLMKQIFSDKSISIREDVNTKFQSLLKNSLSRNDAFDYPFDSLKHIGRIKSEDNRIRIFTWNMPQIGGNQKYFGFILLKEKNQIIELTDSRKSIDNPIKDILSPQNWMGALYYSIINESYKGKTYYILLGLDFNNLFSTKKIIEVLTFGKDSEPIFGSNIFKVGDVTLNRVIFEYSARATMTLRYISDSKTIVFDHLSPSRSDFTDNYQFYGPDFTFDGFRFDNGFWVYVRNLDLRNPKRGPVKPRESPEKLPEPGFLYKSKGGLPMTIEKKKN
jgi:hypothetical protein